MELSESHNIPYITQKEFERLLIAREVSRGLEKASENIKEGLNNHMSKSSEILKEGFIIASENIKEGLNNHMSKASENIKGAINEACTSFRNAIIFLGLCMVLSNFAFLMTLYWNHK